MALESLLEALFTRVWSALPVWEILCRNDPPGKPGAKHCPEWPSGNTFHKGLERPPSLGNKGVWEGEAGEAKMTPWKARGQK